MSVNRLSDLGTSLSRVDGVHKKYLNLSSAERNKVLFPNSADTELSFDEQSNVLGMKILNFEMPHTRYAIDRNVNSLYLSEKWGEDEYHFYSLRVSTGGYSIQSLSAAMELSCRCPVLLSGDKAMGNTYSFNATSLFGKVGFVSSGDYDFTIHAAFETVTLTSITADSATEATVSFFASYGEMFKPGALLTLKAYNYPDREVQVVETISDRTVRLIGYFSDLDCETLSVSMSTMVPYSGQNSVARIMGLGESDLSGHSDFELLSIGSPFSASDDDLQNASVMLVTNFTTFISVGDYVRLSGIRGFMNDAVYQVSAVHDESHMEIYVDRSSLWSHESGRLADPSDPSVEWGVDAIDLSSVSNNLVELVCTLSSPTSLSTGDPVTFVGFDAEELSVVDAAVVHVDDTGSSVTVQFTYPTTYLLEDGVSSLSPVNPDTMIRTTYITPDRFDMSRGRRIALCRAIVDNQDVGSIHIPSLSARSFFGRIQLFSGAELVNFLSKDTAIGTHEFNSVLKRLNKIRLQFFNEDGTPYDFIGVDYTMFLELTCMDSNKGL
ncbi:unnamed protein product [Pylaiella littoralis]